ncbi:MAG: T9SS type A sorting domain-containing protein, partial [Ignavibacteriales bacterium]|nr:T9SS type A sorting domain-containing protein [Ignavibacteriales bacterium]
MKKHLLLLVFLFLQPLILYAQSIGTVSGKLVDQNGNGLAGLQLNLYSTPYIYQTTSSSDGSFSFVSVTGVKDEQLPVGYEVSNNYPNPFNPKTRIDITLPKGGNVRVEVYNLLGQRVKNEIEKYFSSGYSYIDLELKGLPNGFYLAKIILDDKYIVTKKLILMYGSNHFSSSFGAPHFRLSKTTLDGKSTLDTKIDSLVVSGASIVKKVFTNLQSMIGSSLNLNNLIIPVSAPPVPILFSPTNTAVDVSTSPTLTWNSSATATSYTLQVSTGSSFTSFVYNQSGLTNTNQQVSGLVNWLTYYWRVSATNSYGTSAYSGSWSFTILGTPPSAPTLSTPANIAVDVSTSPTLTWNSSTTATSYTLQVSTGSSFTSFVYNQSGLT